MIPSLKDKRIRGVLEDAASRGDPRAVSVLSEQKAHEARRRERTKPTRERKAQRREEWAADTARLRRLAADRDHACVLCGCPFLGAVELHHFESGPDRLRKQAIHNVGLAHPHCHAMFHRSPLVYLPRVKEWCAKLGYPLPEKLRRLAALAESRSARDAGATTTKEPTR